IYRALFVLLVCESAICHPPTIKIPELRNPALPDEVNSLTEHKQYTRSIGGANPSNSYNKIEDTIREVETMLKVNPTLPRLTRGEIMDLIENITKEDMAKGALGKDGDKSANERDPKAIMRVMPFTLASINDRRMEELFTKPPVTHIIGAEPFQLKVNEKDSSLLESSSNLEGTSEIVSSTRPPVIREETFKETSLQGESSRSTSTLISVVFTTTNSPTHVSKQSEGNPNYHRRRPVQQTTNEAKFSTEVPVTTYRPRIRGRRPGKRRPTTTEKHPNHRYPDEEVTESSPKDIIESSSGGIRIVEAPKFNPVVDDLMMQEDKQDDIYQNPKLSLRTASGVELEAANKVSSTISTEASSFEDEERIKQMLASLGILPMQTTTTTTTVPDVSHVADNLTPEMRDLLMNFGLIPNTSERTTTVKPAAVESFNPVKAEVKPESYMSFKPLPEDDTSRQEMEELLARFGLEEKAKKQNDEEEGMNFDAVPEQYKGVLEDIGLIGRGGRMVRSEPLNKTAEKHNVFNPVDTQYASNKEIDKLNKLLEFVKKLEKLNRTVTDEDIQKMDVDNVKELIASLNKDKVVPLDKQNAPNPVNFDHGVDKNEVKRQKETTTTAAPVENATPNLKGLEESFGGQVDASPASEEPAPETTTEARRSGFYYLMDWNTFLDIDDQKGKRVNLRFQPKAGDPKRFLSVSVP
ncbi:hypothetical protein NQ318_001529, partial [Aromia moschata]